MTRKEKAEELFDKMSTNNGDEHHHCTYYVAKQCSLIAVDEVINELASRGILSGFWYEVHLELKKL